MALDQNTATFVQQVSAQTGIDPRVLVAWVQAEGAYAKNGTGHFNYLNVRPTASGGSYSGVKNGVSSGNFETFSSVQDAVTETVNRINQPFAKAILNSAAAKQNPNQQIQAIASTGWDANAYGGSGGSKLLAIFAGIFSPTALNSPYQGPSTALQVSATAGTGSAADAGSGGTSVLPGAAGAVTGAAGSVWNTIDSVPKFLAKITSQSFLLRAGEVVGGAVLTFAGLYLLAKQIGLAPSLPTPAPAKKVAETAEDGLSAPGGYQTSTEGTGEPTRVESFEPTDAREVRANAARRAARARREQREAAIPF